MSKIVRYENGDVAWQFVDIPEINQSTGMLKVIELGAQIDFEIKRVFYLCDIAMNASRGFHAHEELRQFLFCVSGAFSLKLNNGTVSKTYQLTPKSSGLYIDGKVWREMHNFTEGSVMVVLCDREYRYDMVVRDYELFKKNTRVLKSGL